MAALTGFAILGLGSMAGGDAIDATEMKRFKKAYPAAATRLRVQYQNVEVKQHRTTHNLDGSNHEFDARLLLKGASSMHPGGLNLLMLDGSARFVKDTIATWPYNPATGAPVGVITNGSDVWTNLPNPQVWQAIATRNGGEVVDSSGF